jgi:hypothetical protein
VQAYARRCSDPQPQIYGTRPTTTVAINGQVQGIWELPYLGVEKDAALYEHVYFLDPALSQQREELEVTLGIETWWNAISIELLCFSGDVSSDFSLPHYDSEHMAYNMERKLRSYNPPPWSPPSNVATLPQSPPKSKPRRLMRRSRPSVRFN